MVTTTMTTTTTPTKTIDNKFYDLLYCCCCCCLHHCWNRLDYHFFLLLLLVYHLNFLLLWLLKGCLLLRLFRWIYCNCLHCSKLFAFALFKKKKLPFFFFTLLKCKIRMMFCISIILLIKFYINIINVYGVQLFVCNTREKNKNT